jgi:hypothetical protein
MALVCQEALSQTKSSALIPRAASLAQLQSKNWEVSALTGRPSTKRSQTSSSGASVAAGVRTKSP